jgi:uroporphyrin-III C-methyltransferase/precorrin-2 dehydrogenase/sirohydrochlorin ferrochelatase
MRYLPIHIDMKGQTLLVIGGGAAAEAKLRTLIKTQAHIRVIAPEASEQITHWAEGGRIEWLARNYRRRDFKNIRLLYAATEDDALNAKIAQQANKKGLFVNAADQKEACDFITPALVDRAPVAISIGSEGTSPGLARAIKADLESRLPASLGSLAIKINKLRAYVKTVMPDLADRQRFWANILSGRDLTHQIRLSPDEIESRVTEKLSGYDDKRKGFVALVGAGPGNPDLLTFAARQRLHAADVIVYDRLVSKEVLDLGRREAEYIYVGKEPGGKCVPQERINEILIEQAALGKFIVRLKSGDPLIFGRADEETDTLKSHHIGFEIIPGITAAAAAAANIGVSLTARGKNKAFSIITGHDSKGYAEHDWAAMARNDDRFAVYMGVGASPLIQSRLLDSGAPANMPVTIVENASRPEEVIIETTLDQLGQTVKTAPVKGPAVLLIGYAVKTVQSDGMDIIKEAAQ